MKRGGPPHMLPYQSCTRWGLHGRPVARPPVSSYLAFPPSPHWPSSTAWPRPMFRSLRLRAAPFRSASLTLRRVSHCPSSTAWPRPMFRSLRLRGIFHRPLQCTQANAEVYFCCTFPEVAFAGRYPAPCPMVLGLSSHANAYAAVCPAHPDRFSAFERLIRAHK